MYSLAAGFGFESVALGTTPMSKVETALPPFAVGTVAAEHANHVLAEVETEVERVLGSFGSKEYDALVVANIPNGGRLNRVLEQMGVPYAPCPVTGSDASQEAARKQKTEVSKKPVAQKGKGWSWLNHAI
jgi:hypothetical protein